MTATHSSSIVSKICAFAWLLAAILCPVAQAQQSTAEQADDAGLEALTEEQSESLKQRLQAMEENFAANREARHAAVFKRFEEVADNNLSLYNLYVECVETLEYSDENQQRGDQRSARDFDEWRKRLDENVDRSEFASMLLVQIEWLALLKRAEIVTQSYGEDNALAELELAPQAIALFEQILENSEELGRHFRDLNRPVWDSPLAKATGLNDGVFRPKIIPQAPLQVQSLYRKLIIEPAIKEQNIPRMLRGWEMLIDARKKVLRINFEIRKEEQRNRGRNSGRNSERIGDFEDSPELKAFTERSLPQMLWQREVDRFNAGGQVEGARNMYQLIVQYAEDTNSNYWLRQINELLNKAQRQRSQKETAQKAQNQQENP